MLLLLFSQSLKDRMNLDVNKILKFFKGYLLHVLNFNIPSICTYMYDTGHIGGTLPFLMYSYIYVEIIYAHLDRGKISEHSRGILTQ